MANYNAIPYSEKLKIVDLFARGVKVSSIAVQFGIQGTGTVSNIAREFGIPPRSRGHGGKAAEISNTGGLATCEAYPNPREQAS